MRARDRAAAGQLSLFEAEDFVLGHPRLPHAPGGGAAGVATHRRETPTEPEARRAPALDGERASSAPAAILHGYWLRSAGRWSVLWGVIDLRRTVRVELSHRMRSSLGGFWPTERLIRISDVLLEAPRHILEEVLCHEAAHAAAHLLHGERVRSHGREWRELMRKAGLVPRVLIPIRELGRAAQRAARKRWVWEHRCPECRARRHAGRPVRQWRCAPCRAAGRDGRLVITRVAARSLERG